MDCNRIIYFITNIQVWGKTSLIQNTLKTLKGVFDIFSSIHRYNKLKAPFTTAYKKTCFLKKELTRRVVGEKLKYLKSNIVNIGHAGQLFKELSLCHKS